MLEVVVAEASKAAEGGVTASTADVYGARTVLVAATADPGHCEYGVAVR